MRWSFYAVTYIFLYIKITNIILKISFDDKLHLGFNYINENEFNKLNKKMDQHGLWEIYS
jgi:hypothetical protein